MLSTTRKHKDVIEDDRVFVKENTDESPAELETNGPETKNGIICGTIYVTLRKKPDYMAEFSEYLTRGDRVVVLEEGKDFHKVRAQNGHEGYIPSSFLKEE